MQMLAAARGCYAAKTWTPLHRISHDPAVVVVMVMAEEYYHG